MCDGAGELGRRNSSPSTMTASAPGPSVFAAAAPAAAAGDWPAGRARGLAAACSLRGPNHKAVLRMGSTGVGGGCYRVRVTVGAGRLRLERPLEKVHHSGTGREHWRREDSSTTTGRESHTTRRESERRSKQQGGSRADRRESLDPRTA